MTAAATTTVERRTLSRKEVAAMLGVSVETLDRHRDELPAPIRVGRQLLYDRDTIVAFIRGEQAR